MAGKIIDVLNSELNRLIGKPQASGLTLTGWRFDLHQVNQVEVGLKNNRLGGPYSSPSFKEDMGGEIFLHWDQGKYTSGKLDRHTLEEFETNWELWQRTAFIDDDGPELVAPYDPPRVEVLDEKVRKVVSGEDRTPFELLTLTLRKLQEGYGTKKIDGRFRATLDKRTIQNSMGLNVQYEQSPVSFFVSGEDTFGDSYSEKCMPLPEQIDHLTNYVGETLKLLHNETTLPLTGRIPILLPPKVMEAFLDHYLISNLMGSLVFNKQSAYAKEDFIQQRQAFRGDLTLSIDGSRPLRSGSYRCTSEGIPSGQIDLVKEGRLITPVLNTKYGKRLRMKPTPIPAGNGLLLRIPAVGNMEDLYRSVENCLIVHSILGLHTQDYSSGDFSLSADQCLWVEKGEVKGKVKAVIAGNFFRALQSTDTAFAYTEKDDNPSMLFPVDVC
jgi:PmbA protein